MPNVVCVYSLQYKEGSWNNVRPANTMFPYGGSWRGRTYLPLCQTASVIWSAEYPTPLFCSLHISTLHHIVCTRLHVRSLALTGSWSFWSCYFNGLQLQSKEWFYLKEAYIVSCYSFKLLHIHSELRILHVFGSAPPSYNYYINIQSF